MDQSSITPNTSNQQLVLNGDNESATALLEKQARRDGLRDVSFLEYMTVGILCFVNLINYMDRFTLAGVLVDVKDEFKIGDDKAGLLQTVFVVAYMVFAPIFGYLGDRYSRRSIMAFGVALWCMTTFAGSFIKYFEWFAVFRGLVGIGEASYSTIAPTIISDLFVGNIRTKMLALFYFAIPVGSGMGYIVGSVAGAAAGNWRWGLRVTPFLGAIAVGLILWVMEDPERGRAEESTIKPTPYTTDLKSLVKNRSFMLSTLAFTCVAFVTGALAWWGPQYIFLGLTLQPNVDITIESVSYKFGLVGMFAGALGVPLGSALAQRLRAHCQDSDPLVCGFALLASAPLVYLGLITVDAHAALTYLLIFLGMVTLNLTWSIVADIVLVSEFLNWLSFMFGVVTMVAGLLGVPLGAWLGTRLNKSCKRAHPLICGVGLLMSAPAMALGMLLCESYFYLPFVCIFIGQLTLNLNWAIVADMSMYVVIPPRRSTAEAFQILISHMFGDAGSPYLVGVISESLKRSLSTDSTEMPSKSVQFRALQYALFVTCFVEVLGGVFFLLTSAYIAKDKQKVDRALAEAEGRNREPLHRAAHDEDTTSEN